MSDKIGMAIVGADGKLLGGEGFETFKEEMERAGARLFEFLVEKYGEELKDEFAEVINGALLENVNLWTFRVVASKAGSRVAKLAIEHRKYRTRKKNKNRFWRMVEKERAKNARW